eukprot:CFRG4393T1
MGSRNLLICVDRSEGGVYAAEWAFQNVVREADNVTLLSVIDTYTHYVPVYGTTVTFDTTTSKVQYDMIEHAEGLLAYLVKQLEMREGQILTQIEAGDPRDVVVELCEKEDISMVILGTSNKTYLRRKLVGSVGDYLVSQCDCPVLVVKKNK